MRHHTVSRWHSAMHLPTDFPAALLHRGGLAEVLVRALQLPSLYSRVSHPAENARPQLTGEAPICRSPRLVWRQRLACQKNHCPLLLEVNAYTC